MMGMLDSLFGAETQAPTAAAPVPSQPLDRPPRTILLDGANLAWSYGEVLAEATGGTKRPLSHGVVMAVRHRPWQLLGYRVKAYLPYEYMEGRLEEIVDGGKVGSISENVVCLDRQEKTWRNTVLYDLYTRGELTTVVRGSGNASADDLSMLQQAKVLDEGRGAYICSNDHFRDHKRSRNMGFETKRRFRAWLEERRLSYSFTVDLSATGLTTAEMEEVMGDTRRYWDLPREEGLNSVATFRPVPNPTMLLMERRAKRKAEELGVSIPDVIGS